tara:strand:+ start:4428 stop:5615 length:1188 start_codon:yes stop_codon:yes gene_type:complete
LSRIKALFLAGGFPTSDNPSHGIFNYRAAIQLSEFVDLTVVQFRFYRPGRKLFEIEKIDNFQKITLCLPIVPVYQKPLFLVNNAIYRIFTRRLIHEYLKSADIVHAGDGSLSLFPSQLKKRYKYKMLTQFIGGDLNQDFKGFEQRNWVKKWKSCNDAFTFNSKALRKVFRSYFGEHENLEVIYRGVNLSHFQIEEDRKEANEIKFYCLGGIPNYTTFEHGRNTKGGLTLMKAWSMIDKDISLDNAQIKLLFAGPDSDSEITQEWKNGLRYKEKVVLLGKIRPEEIKAFHSENDVAIIPSLEEGLPNVGMEAAASGKVIVATKVGGIPEIVEDRVSGLLCEANDADALYRQIKFVANNYSDMLKYGKRARLKMEKEFSDQSFGADYYKLYQKLTRN